MRALPVKTFLCKPHQWKEAAYVRALIEAGYTPVRNTRGASFALYDGDWSGDLRRPHPKLVIFDQHNIPFFLYPHAARPMVQYDGMIKPWPHTKCAFTIAAGHVEIMQLIGYPIPLEVTGWTYCKIKAFKPVEKVKKILFGPIHPTASGWISPVDKQINQKAYSRLLEYCQENKARLTVRHICSLEASGLVKEPGIKYVQANPDLTTKEIDQADLVVGHQTFAYLAVARGKPTLMMGEDVPPRTGNKPITFRYVANWERYAELLMFPLDILAVHPSDVDSLIAQAAGSDEKIATWRRRFIGEQFDGRAFVARLESYL